MTTISNAFFTCSGLGDINYQCLSYSASSSNVLPNHQSPCSQLVGSLARVAATRANCSIGTAGNRACLISTVIFLNPTEILQISFSNQKSKCRLKLHLFIGNDDKKVTFQPKLWFKIQIGLMQPKFVTF